MNIFYNTEFLKNEIEETRKKDMEAEVECERRGTAFEKSLSKAHGSSRIE